MDVWVWLPNRKAAEAFASAAHMTLIAVNLPIPMP